jgi:glycosyltransferase involved in cell wall biosynthesis
VGDPSLSIVVCTLNRARRLEDALASFAAVRKPPGFAYELIVVDNGSTDETRAVVETTSERAEPGLRYVYEPRVGLSSARNRAITEAKGTWIWFFDDDVVLSRDWLEGARHGVERFAESAALGGRVVAAFETGRPVWLSNALLPYYGATDFGERSRLLADGEYPIGANAGYRRDALEEVGGFREDLGHVGNAFGFNEEPELVNRLRAAGHTVAYVPQATVEHRIGAERARMWWLLKRAYRGGLYLVRAEAPGRRSARAQSAGKAAWVLGAIAAGIARGGVGRERQVMYAWQLGMIQQYAADAIRPPASRDDCKQRAGAAS